MVTAKSSELDTVRGLDCGADDYISKPFGIMEFLSRVRASLRRAAPEERPNVLSFHEILLDNARHSVTVNNQPVELTYKEYSLLRLLLENTNLVVTRETILQVVWGTDIRWKAALWTCTSAPCAKAGRCRTLHWHHPQGGLQAGR